MFALFVGCCLLPVIGALPTNYAQNISLGYSGDKLADLDTVNNLTVIDPAMAAPLQAAIANAWPDYYAHLSGNGSTTTMSPEDAAWFTQTNLVNFWVDFHNVTGQNSSGSLSSSGIVAGGPLLSPGSGENGTTLQGNSTLPGLLPQYDQGVANSSTVLNASSIVTVSPIGNTTDLLENTLPPLLGGVKGTDLSGPPMLTGANGTDLTGTSMLPENFTALAPGMTTTMPPLTLLGADGTTTMAAEDLGMETTSVGPLGVALNETDLETGPALHDPSLTSTVVPEATDLTELGLVTTGAPLTSSADALDFTGITPLPLGVEGATTVSPLMTTIASLTSIVLGDGTSIVPGTTTVAQLGEMATTLVPGTAATSIAGQEGTTLAPAMEGQIAATTMGIPTGL